MKTYKEFIEEATGSRSDMYQNSRGTPSDQFVHGPEAKRNMKELEDFHKNSEGYDTQTHHKKMVGNPKIASEEDVWDTAKKLGHIDKDAQIDDEDEHNPEHLLHRTHFLGQTKDNRQKETELRRELKKNGFEGAQTTTYPTSDTYEGDTPADATTIFEPKKHIRHVKTVDRADRL